MNERNNFHSNLIYDKGANEMNIEFANEFLASGVVLRKPIRFNSRLVAEVFQENIYVLRKAYDVVTFIIFEPMTAVGCKSAKTGVGIIILLENGGLRALFLNIETPSIMNKESILDAFLQWAPTFRLSMNNEITFYTEAFEDFLQKNKSDLDLIFDSISFKYYDKSYEIRFIRKSSQTVEKLIVSCSEVFNEKELQDEKLYLLLTRNQKEISV